MSLKLGLKAINHLKNGDTVVMVLKYPLFEGFVKSASRKEIMVHKESDIEIGNGLISFFEKHDGTPYIKKVLYVNIDDLIGVDVKRKLVD